MIADVSYEDVDLDMGYVGDVGPQVDKLMQVVQLDEVDLSDVG